MFKEIKNKMNPDTIGGSPFFGLKKIVLKSHGNSTSETIYSSIKKVRDIHLSGFVDKLKEGLKEV